MLDGLADAVGERDALGEALAVVELLVDSVGVAVLDGLAEKVDDGLSEMVREVECDSELDAVEEGVMLSEGESDQLGVPD